MFGMAIGSVLFTFLSDKYGRKFSNILAGLCFLATGIAMSFVPTYAAFAVMKVIQGATQMVVYTQFYIVIIDFYEDGVNVIWRLFSSRCATLLK